MSIPPFRHTFLFEPARWEAQGVFTDGSGRLFPLTGFSLILHTDRSWVLEGKVRLLGEEMSEFSQTCAIVPLPEGNNETSWTSVHTTLGRLQGRFSLAGELLFFFFSGAGGGIHGSEWLRQIAADTYENRGVLFQGERFLSAWASTLKRRE